MEVIRMTYCHNSSKPSSLRWKSFSIIVTLKAGQSTNEVYIQATELTTEYTMKQEGES